MEKLHNSLSIFLSKSNEIRFNFCGVIFLYYSLLKSGSNHQLKSIVCMKFYVCIKQVPDVNAPLQIKDGELIQDADRSILNAYDASAVEEALVLKEAHGAEVEVVLAGPEKAKETIRKALAMGADKGTHIITDENSDHDSFTYANILAAFFKDKEYDYISCGKQSQDTDSGLTGSMLAQLLEASIRHKRCCSIF